LGGITRKVFDMCLINEEIEQLKKMRKKGHVLIPMYKLVRKRWDGSYRSAIYDKTWFPGEHIAKGVRGGPMRKKTPYRKGARINESIHIFGTKKPAERAKRYEYCPGDYSILECWVYADELTGCCGRAIKDELIKDEYVYTTPRVFVKRLPHQRKDHYTVKEK